MADEETPSRSGVASSRQVHVDDLAELVDGAVQVTPPFQVVFVSEHLTGADVPTWSLARMREIGEFIDYLDRIDDLGPLPGRRSAFRFGGRASRLWWLGLARRRPDSRCPRLGALGSCQLLAFVAELGDGVFCIGAMVSQSAAEMAEGQRTL